VAGRRGVYCGTDRTGDAGEGVLMARSDLLRRLFASYARGDDATFRAVAAQMVADERLKNHRLLANELEQALASDLHPGAATPLTLRPLPKGRDDRPLLRLSKPERRFDDLVLAESTADALTEVVEENLSRTVLISHGLRPRQRLLLVGPSGTGKSVSAHAIAAELSLPVATASLAALTSSFLGETARNVEAVVRFAEQTPCVLLLDEFDTLAQERGNQRDHGEIRRVVATVLQLLEEIRGESLVIATSNHPGLLDSATWRRFDHVVHFAALNTTQRAKLIELKLLAVPHQISTQKWARRLRGASPAEVESICTDALRRGVLTGAERLTDEFMADAAARLKARRDAMGNVEHTTSGHQPDNLDC
jgi:SpoVK/Ycf46/Vps4 family AAA+-type ATPase